MPTINKPAPPQQINQPPDIRTVSPSSDIYLPNNMANIQNAQAKKPQNSVPKGQIPLSN